MRAVRWAHEHREAVEELLSCAEYMGTSRLRPYSPTSFKSRLSISLRHGSEPSSQRRRPAWDRRSIFLGGDWPRSAHCHLSRSRHCSSLHDRVLLPMDLSISPCVSRASVVDICLRFTSLLTGHERNSFHERSGRGSCVCSCTFIGDISGCCPILGTGMAAPQIYSGEMVRMEW